MLGCRPKRTAAGRGAASFSICLGFVESTPNGRDSTQELETKPKSESRGSGFAFLCFRETVYLA